MSRECSTAPASASRAIFVGGYEIFHSLYSCAYVLQVLRRQVHTVSLSRRPLTSATQQPSVHTAFDGRCTTSFNKMVVIEFRYEAGLRVVVERRSARRVLVCSERLAKHVAVCHRQ